MSRRRIVDFEPAIISGIAVRNEHVALVFPAQVLFECEDGLSSHLPHVLCELRVWKGTATTENITFPLRVQNVRVHFRGGERRCFLPVGFRAAGPVHVSLEFASGEQIVTSGASITLRVIRGTGEIPVTYK